MRVRIVLLIMRLMMEMKMMLQQKIESQTH